MRKMAFGDKAAEKFEEEVLSQSGTLSRKRYANMKWNTFSGQPLDEVYVLLVQKMYEENNIYCRKKRHRRICA